MASDKHFAPSSSPVEASSLATSATLSQPPREGSTSPGGYLRMRDTALLRGVDALAYLQSAGPGKSPAAASYNALRKDWLGDSSQPADDAKQQDQDQFNSIANPLSGAHT